MGIRPYRKPAPNTPAGSSLIQPSTVMELITMDKAAHKYGSDLVVAPGACCHCWCCCCIGVGGGDGGDVDISVSAE